MDLRTPAGALQRLLQTLTRLVLAIGAQPAALAAALRDPLHLRLDDLATRLIRLAIRLVREDAFPPETVGRVSEVPPAARPPARPIPFRPPNPNPLPRRRGWLLAALPDIAPAFADEFRAILQDPAFATLLASNPQTRRLLQPLCRMLALTIPPTVGPEPLVARVSQTPPATQPRTPVPAQPHAPPPKALAHPAPPRAIAAT